MRIGPDPFHFRSIVYTVSIDAFYDSSVDLVCQSLTNALTLLSHDGCTTVSVPALATGYGHLSRRDFGRALWRCIDQTDWPFDELRVVLRSDLDIFEQPGVGVG